MAAPYVRPGTEVVYHGSQTSVHGSGRVVAECGCLECCEVDHDRYELRLDSGRYLEHVRRASFTAQD